jgi:HD-GYP domain-containing protein (c-di-GMP phosphodiesterase class II)
MSPTRLRILVSAAASDAMGARVPAAAQRFAAVADLSADGAGAVLVLTPSEAQEVLARPGDTPVVVLWVGTEPVPPALLADARVAGVLDAACRPETIEATFRTATARGTEVGAAQRLERVLDIGRALASEKDLDTLLSLILTHACHLTNADGASIYTREAQGSASAAGAPSGETNTARGMPGAADRDGKLYFRLWQNASTASTSNAQKTLVGEYSIAGYVARAGGVVMLDDAYAIPDSAPYKFNPASDRSLNYRTRSLLTVPLKNKADETVGVLQLVNRKDRPEVLLKTAEDVERHVRPFDAECRALALALAGQAGVALENSMLYADIERLFEGFIKASVAAIEARDPTTAGHSFRVADFTERLAIAVDRTDQPDLRAVSFTREQLRELRYAALLHDFGKVGVREQVLVKAKKLHPHQFELLQHRFRYARASLERRAYRELVALHEDGMGDAERALQKEIIRRRLEDELARLDRFLDVVGRANEPTVSHQEVSDPLDAVAGYTFPGEAGETLTLLQEFEFADLALSKGSLNAEERTQIESHVSHTYAFLSLIPWTKNLANLPDIAFAHHEKLDGTGYPRRLSGATIPVQSRMMTISDIYDALTAGDRPYKRALPVERALDILGAEAKAGKIDAGLFRVFVESEAWQLGR